jgi:hypothetical protein
LAVRGGMALWKDRALWRVMVYCQTENDLPAGVRPGFWGCGVDGCMAGCETAEA